MPTLRPATDALQKATGIGPTAFDPVQAQIDRMGGVKGGSAPLPVDPSSLKSLWQVLTESEGFGPEFQTLRKFIPLALGDTPAASSGLTAAQQAALNATAKETGASASEMAALKKWLFGE